MTTSSDARKTVLVAANTPFVRDRFKTALDAAGHRIMVVKSVPPLLAYVHADLDDIRSHRNGFTAAPRRH
jgi:hypothetical protein